MNPIRKLQFGREYISGPKASTDLHAGGIFFCIPYEEIIQFEKEGEVVLSRRVIEDFRPMDGQSDIDAINQYKLYGMYNLSGKGYIECQFEDLSMVGLPLEQNPDILTFHCYYRSRGYAFGDAFTLSR